MSETPAFTEFPKIARLSRECVITEKIDGTNASIFIAEDGQPITLLAGRVVPFLTGSRTRWIFPESDNAGFSRWAYEHAEELLGLGPGHHFGEWWGSGIQRGYGLEKGEKRFSLFNVARWADDPLTAVSPDHAEHLAATGARRPRPACCSVVPVLYRGPFDSAAIDGALSSLEATGSLASPGFMRPEGIVVWHEAARVLFKKTIDKDEAPKGLSR